MSVIISPDSPLSWVSSISSVSPIDTVTTVTEYTPISSVSPLGILPLGYLEDKKYTPTIRFSQDKPLTISFYENLNFDSKIHQRLTKFFYYKTLDKWLYKDLHDILNYLKVKDGKVSIINSMKDYDALAVEKDTQKDADLKVKFIEDNVFTKHDMKRILQEYIAETGTNWVDLPKNSYFIKKLTKDKIMRHIKRLMATK